MLNLIPTTAPVFILIALGYLSIKAKIVSEDGIASMAKVVLYFTLPALIFSTVAGMEFHEVIVPQYFLGYMFGSVAMLGIGIFLYRIVFKRGLAESTLKGLGMSNSNSAFFGYPVMLLAFEHPPTAAFTMALIIENIVILPLGFALLELSQTHAKSPIKILLNVAKRLVKSPLIIAVSAGVLASTFHVELPNTADRVLSMLSGASATLALLVLGASLLGTKIKGNAKDISIVVIGKLVGHPIMVGLLLWVMPDVDKHLLYGGILIAAVPMMSIYPILASPFGFRQVSASTLLVTTICSFFTLMVVLAYIQN